MNPADVPESEEVEELGGWDLTSPNGSQSTAITSATPDQQFWFLLGNRAAAEANQRRADDQLQQLRRQIDLLRQELADALSKAGSVDGGHASKPAVREGASASSPNGVAAATPTLASISDRGDATPLRPRGGAQPDKVVLVAALGLAGVELKRVAAMAAAQMATGRVLPIVITDTDQLDPLRRPRLPLEYIPSPALQRKFAPDRDWDLYVRRRFELICRKWRPGALIVFGTGSGKLIDVAKDLGLTPP